MENITRLTVTRLRDETPLVAVLWVDNPSKGLIADLVKLQDKWRTAPATLRQR